VKVEESAERAIEYLFKLSYATLGFMAVKSSNRELVGKMCEKLFEKYNVKPDHEKDSEEYFDKCLELAVKRNKHAREFFYQFGVLHSLLTPIKALLEVPEFKKAFEEAVHIIKENLDIIIEEIERLNWW
jgi:hypothetical protein